MVRHFSNCCYCAGSWGESATEPFKSRVSAPYSPMTFLDIASVGFQNHMFWELVSLVLVPIVRMPNVGHKAFAPLGEVPYLLDSSQLWVTPRMGLRTYPSLFYLFWCCPFILCFEGAYSGSFQAFLEGIFPHIAVDFLSVGRDDLGSSYAIILNCFTTNSLYSSMLMTIFGR